MKKLLLTTGALLLLAGPAASSGLGELCDGTQQVTVGQWAQYQTDVPFLTAKMEARFAIVDTEAVDGKGSLLARGRYPDGRWQHDSPVLG